MLRKIFFCAVIFVIFCATASAADFLGLVPGKSTLDDAGRYAVFHSLRHSTGSLLAAAGVHPKVAQSIMMHSSINLTMSRYTH